MFINRKNKELISVSPYYFVLHPRLNPHFFTIFKFECTTQRIKDISATIFSKLAKNTLLEVYTYFDVEVNRGQILN